MEQFFPETFNLFQLGIVSLVIQLRYLIIAGTAFFIFYRWKKDQARFPRIQSKLPKSADYWREIGYSTLTAVIFACIALSFTTNPVRSFTKFYTDINEHPTWWFFVSIPLMLLIHDTYFYWTHRAMHHPRIFKYFHLVHHKSTNPSPWAAFAFHPLEAVVEAGIFPVFLFLMPIHPSALLIFLLIMTTYNVYGHLGYELLPKSALKHPVGRWLNTSILHNRHHEHFDGNYGLYFLWWDRWMGTLRTDNEEKIEAVYISQKTSVQKR